MPVKDAQNRPPPQTEVGHRQRSGTSLRGGHPLIVPPTPCPGLRLPVWLVPWPWLSQPSDLVKIQIGLRVTEDSVRLQQPLSNPSLERASADTRLLGGIVQGSPGRHRRSWYGRLSPCVATARHHAITVL